MSVATVPVAASRDRALGRGRIDSGFVVRALMFVVVGLTLFGVMFVFSTTSVALARAGRSPWSGLLQHLLYVAIASVVFIIVFHIDYHRWQIIGPVAFLAVLLLNLAVFTPLGVSVHGARRWLALGPTSLQPSEMFKFCGVVVIANAAAYRADRGRSMHRLMRPTLLVLGICGVVVAVFQQDFGTFLLISVGALSVYFVSAPPWSHLGFLVALGGALGGLLVVLEPFRLQRLMEFIGRSSTGEGVDLQQYQARLALASGGPFGVDVGAGRAKWGFLPNAQNDFIFAVIGEEVGILGTLFVVALFLGVAVLGTWIALRAQDNFGRFVAIGVTSVIVGQALVNIAAVIDLIPVTGVPLPFVSQGGTALMVLSASVAVLANIARQGQTRPAGSAVSAAGDPRRARSATTPSGSTRSGSAAARGLR